MSPTSSDAGELVYTSNAPNLVADDADSWSDVFVNNIATASQTRLQLSHVGAPAFTEAFAAISADGRYVAVTGYEIGAMGEDIFNVYAIDRQLQTSYDISVRPDGSRDNASMSASISADGGFIAFMGSPAVIHGPEMIGGVYVATAVDVSPSDVDVPAAGESFSIEVSVAADVAWQARLVVTDDGGGYATLENYSGVGPTTLDVEVPPNDTGNSLEYHLWLGSREARLHQAGAPILDSIYPSDGPATMEHHS